MSDSTPTPTPEGGRLARIRKLLRFHRGIAEECRASGLAGFSEGRAVGIEDLIQEIEEILDGKRDEW